jgi:hypothetical protein
VTGGALHVTTKLNQHFSLKGWTFSSLRNYLPEIARLRRLQFTWLLWVEILFYIEVNGLQVFGSLAEKYDEFRFIHLSACNISRQARRIFMKVGNRRFVKMYFRSQISVPIAQKYRTQLPTHFSGTEIVDITEVRVCPR